ncbi:hypothetical protein M8C21_001269 [Ambrosia artemisiifolia]|uniref:Uncharacterized protein n=1 Tax=Ambrosia artemisiifolia TaxID=4212 RepID=A0AAD5BX85_AMBAR|nr:hypothetical protein M8C21_001269 [Ambrosia artemisiifolia]
MIWTINGSRRMQQQRITDAQVWANMQQLNKWVWTVDGCSNRYNRCRILCAGG